MTPDHTLAVDCNVRDSAITHSQYAARRVKDAICDQFRERTGVRPSVDPERPMVGFNLHVFRDHATLSLDGSWDSLHKRGYRPIQTIAKLNARNAGVGHLVQLERRDLAEARPPAGAPPGVVICNPPYGERIGEEKEWLPLYAKLGAVVGEHWRGWRLFVFTSNDRLARK